MSKRRIVAVMFASGNGLYDFYTYLDDVTIGDKVVCLTVNGLAIGTVIGLPTGSSKASKWVVCKIDIAAHERKVLELTEADRIEAELEARKAEILNDGSLLEVLARGDAKTDRLLKRLKKIKGDN